MALAASVRSVGAGLGFCKVYCYISGSAEQRFCPVARGSAFREGNIAGDSYSATYAGRRMAKQESIELDGVVRDVLPDRNYRVELENGHQILAYATGKMSKFRIRVLVGDRVTVEVSPYDFNRGRITFRHKDGDMQGPPRPAHSRRR